MNPSKLVLGTVQFGRKYGFEKKIINKQNKVNEILELSKKFKILSLDTATDYLNAEKKIGNYKKRSFFKIITKLPRIESKKIKRNEINYIEKKLFNSLSNLKQKNIYGVLIHYFDDILKPGSKHLIDFLKDLKKKKIIKKFGISVYSPKQFNMALNIFIPDIVQFPLNILDQRFLKIDLNKYKKIDFYARSIFLQGLLLHDTSNLPNFFLPIKKKLEKMVKYCKKNDISQLEACINFIKEQKNINYFILGIDNHEQLEQIIHIFKKKKNSNINFSKFSINNSKFIDPRNWKL